MTQTKFLITGATGDTGGYTVRQLLEKNQAVRVLAHRPDERSEELQKSGAKVMFGDLLDFDSVRAALSGVDRAYFCYPICPGIVQATAQFAQAAKEAGVEVIVNMSQISARGDAKSEAARQHWLSERVFDWSGVPTVHLRPTFFAEWLLYLAPMIRKGKILAPFTATGRHAPVAAEDQARVIVAILQNPIAHFGKTYPLYGAVGHTLPEIAAIVGHVIGKEVTYQQVPIEQYAEVYSPKRPAQNTAKSMYSDPGALSGGPAKAFLMQHLHEVAIDHSNGIFAGTNNYIAEIGGRPPMTVEEFVTRNREAFA
ncbi:NmrA family NAD(P)-binding protein [Candidatus Binatus sp.]|uniref:NmrA family NAD(P)-binding protein n=1 Tax=Candidatus Binatus sp. TaxID=2811406 RepID=UPI003BAEE40F